MKQGDRYPAPKAYSAPDPHRDLRRAIRALAEAEASASGKRLELIRRRKARLTARLGRKRRKIASVAHGAPPAGS